jgi:S-disulfanyl-L-cysteine oxidoreductase SoxD
MATGKGGAAAALVRDQKIAGIFASQKTIKNFWPYSTTIFDFIHRAMPFQMPRSLSDDEVYALTAYILAENKLIGGGRYDGCTKLAEGEDAKSG